MNGILQTALLFYVRSRVQRWFFALALGSLAARSLLLRLPCGCRSPTSSWYFLVQMVSVLPVLGFASVSLMSSGGLFRTVSSLRTVYLIPRSRTQLAGGLLLAQVLAAALVTLLVVTLGPSSGRGLAWGSTRGTFEYVFGIATLTVVLLQFIAGPSRVISLLAGALILGFLAELDLFMQPEIAGVPTPDVLSFAALAVWAAFAAWYSGIGPIAPVAAVWSARSVHHASTRTAPTTATRAAAIDAYLLGHPSLWLACRKQLSFWMLYIAGFGIVMGFRPFWSPHLRHVPPQDFSVASLLSLLAIASIGNSIAARIARQSRALWLRSGDSRQALFARAERLAWRALALVGVPLSLAGAAAWTFLPHQFTHAVYPVAVYLTVAPCGLYSGLLKFTRARDLPFLIVFLIMAQGGVIAAMLHEDSPDLPIGGVPLSFWFLPLGLAVLAFVMRRIAERRWVTIDWLRHRCVGDYSVGSINTPTNSNSPV